jgi:hypothetical protein
MSKILIGSGNATIVLEVPNLPKVGDRIFIREDMIVSSAVFFVAIKMVGNYYTITKRYEDYQYKNGSIPHFGMELSSS